MFAFSTFVCATALIPQPPGQLAVSRLLLKNLDAEINSVKGVQVQGLTEDPGLIPFLASYYNLYKALAITKDWKGLRKLQNLYLSEDFGRPQHMFRLGTIDATINTLNQIEQITKFEPHVDQVKADHLTAAATVTWNLAGWISVDSSSKANNPFFLTPIMPSFVEFEGQITVINIWVKTDSCWRLRVTQTKRISAQILGQTSSVQYP